MAEPKTIAEYIANEPAPIRKILKQVRAIVKKNAPQAAEKLAWGMPTFHQEGNLLHFAAFSKHFSVFPGSDAIAHFKRDLAEYVTSKGTVQFPYETKVPATLIAKIAKFCVKRNLALAEAKKKKKLARKKAKKVSARPRRA